MPPAYRLPELPYEYSALEPHISGRIMELHHDKHHATYVEGANKTLEQLDEARDKAETPSAAGPAFSAVHDGKVYFCTA